MKKWSWLLVLIPVSGFAQQAPIRTYTKPGHLFREDLDRLSLSQAWRTRLPTLGMRDGLASVTILPQNDSSQVLVQTLSGTLYLLDGETGHLLWKSTVGHPYWESQTPGYNSKSIFVTRRNHLHIINRLNGQERLYYLDKDSKQPVFGFSLLGSPSTPPTADERTMAIGFGSTIALYALPIFEVDEAEREKETGYDGRIKRPSLVPEFIWSYPTGNTEIIQAPVIGDSQVGVMGTNGAFLSLNQFPAPSAELWDTQLRSIFKTRGTVNAPLGQHGGQIFLGSEDSTLYSLNIRSTRLDWRLLAGGPIVRQPLVTDQDVFVSAQRAGLYRVDRQLGTEIWTNSHAEQFLATNNKFVYARDRFGNLMILDYQRGTALASYDLKDWIISAPNEWTDRIYLANHDGQILCLHHKDNSSPIKLKTQFIFQPTDQKLKNGKPPAKELPKVPEKKEEEKNKEKAKDDGKIGLLFWKDGFVSLGFKERLQWGPVETVFGNPKSPPKRRSIFAS